MKKISMDGTLKENATSIIETFDEYVSNIKIKEGFKKSVLNQTADIWLSKRQFNCFKKFLQRIGESEFIITQMDAFYSVRNDIPAFQISSDIKYSEYYNLPLYDTSIAFSENSNWAMCIEEGVDYGKGIFAVKNSMWEIFKQCFSECINDANCGD